MGSVIKRFLSLTIKKKVAACDCPAFPVEIGGKKIRTKKKMYVKK